MCVCVIRRFFTVSRRYTPLLSTSVFFFFFSLRYHGISDLGGRSDKRNDDGGGGDVSLIRISFLYAQSNFRIKASVADSTRALRLFFGFYTPISDESVSIRKFHANRSFFFSSCKPTNVQNTHEDRSFVQFLISVGCVCGT